MEIVLNKLIKPADRLMQGSVIGMTVTAFTIYSHIDSFIKLSQTVRALAVAWRDIIALPWEIIAGVFGLDIAKPTAGLITVLLATALVVKSAWKETRKVMAWRFRTIAIIVCSCIGFLYSALIIVPALYDETDPTFEVTSIAVEALADMYYTNVDTVGPISSLIWWTTTAIILGIYGVLLAWPFHQKESTKSTARSSTGIVLSVLFIIILADRVLYNFLPIQLAGEDILGSILIAIALGAVLVAPFAASVYLSDPFTSARRSLSIATLLLIIFVLDRAALCVEWIAARLPA